MTDRKKGGINDSFEDEINKFIDDGYYQYEVGKKNQKTGLFKAEAGEKILDLKKNGIQIDYNQIYEIVREENRNYEPYRQQKVVPVDNSTGAGTVVSICLLELEDSYFQNTDEYLPTANDAIKRFSEFTDTLNYPERINPLLIEFRLDQPYKGQRSAYELFNTAWELFRESKGENAEANASLDDMRHSMNVAIDRLVKMCPNQTRSKKDKIFFIYSRIGNNQKTDEEIAYLQHKYTETWEVLSGSKTTMLEKWGHWKTRMLDASLFLESLLSSLDSKKMRVK